MLVQRCSAVIHRHVVGMMNSLSASHQMAPATVCGIYVDAPEMKEIHSSRETNTLKRVKFIVSHMYYDDSDDLNLCLVRFQLLWFQLLVVTIYNSVQCTKAKRVPPK